MSLILFAAMTYPVGLDEDRNDNEGNAQPYGEESGDGVRYSAISEKTVELMSAEAGSILSPFHYRRKNEYICHVNPIAIRLLGQQLVCPLFSSPHDVVAWMGAMQGQEYRMMRWAVAMRTKKPSARAFMADFNSGAIIRTHLLRTTWQLVAAEDYAWMLSLCRNKALGGLRGWMHANGIDIPASEEESISAIFAEAVSGRNDVLKEDLGEALIRRDIRMDDQRLSYHIRLAELSGLLCSGILHPYKRTLALVSERIPQAALPMEQDEALSLLARKYFQSHSPATLEDFLWWSGLNKRDCLQGIFFLGGELSAEKWKGQTFYLHDGCRLRGFRSGHVHLLPSYDEYLIGYKSRHIALHPGYRHHAHDNSGTFWNVVLQDGEVIGNWSAAGGDVSVTLFHQDARLNETALQKERERYRHFLKCQ